MSFEWTIEWPTEPGTYLFRGCRRKEGVEHAQTMLKPVVAHVAKTATGSLMYIGHDFMNKNDYIGAWSKLELGPESLHPRARYLFFLKEVWEILTQYAGAQDSDWNRRDFMEAMTGNRDRDGVPPTEWRFQGKFGFGGKLYRSDPWRIGCYPEDLTAELEKEMDAINAMIQTVTSDLDVNSNSYRIE